MVYNNVSIIAIIIGFFCLGYLFNNLLRKIIDGYNDGKYKKEITDIFQNVLDNLYTNKTSFVSRINGTVTIKTELNVGIVNVVYLMDRHDIAIFKGEDLVNIASPKANVPKEPKKEITYTLKVGGDNWDKVLNYISKKKGDGLEKIIQTF